MGAIVNNAGLVRKVYFPRETLVLAQVLHGLVQFSIEMTLLVIVLLVFGSPLLLWLPVTILLMLLLALFGTGFGLALSVLSVFFRDLNYLWGIVLQVWFFATPIVYPPDLLEGRVPDWVQTILNNNPMAKFAAAFRRTLYDGAAPGWKAMLVLALLSFGSVARRMVDLQPLLETARRRALICVTDRTLGAVGGFLTGSFHEPSTYMAPAS